MSFKVYMTLREIFTAFAQVVNAILFCTLYLHRCTGGFESKISQRPVLPYLFRTRTIFSHHITAIRQTPKNIANEKANPTTDDSYPLLPYSVRSICLNHNTIYTSHNAIRQAPQAFLQSTFGPTRPASQEGDSPERCPREYQPTFHYFRYYIHTGPGLLAQESSTGKTCRSGTYTRNYCRTYTL